MINTQFKSLIDLVTAFPTEQSCIDYLEQLRWNGNVISPYDHTSVVYKCKTINIGVKTHSKHLMLRQEHSLTIQKSNLLSGSWLYGWLHRTKKGYHHFNWQRT